MAGVQGLRLDVEPPGLPGEPPAAGRGDTWRRTWSSCSGASNIMCISLPAQAASGGLWRTAATPRTRRGVRAASPATAN